MLLILYINLANIKLLNFWKNESCICFGTQEHREYQLFFPKKEEIPLVHGQNCYKIPSDRHANFRFKKQHHVMLNLG
jgi:hypothetical protein